MPTGSNKYSRRNTFQQPTPVTQKRGHAQQHSSPLPRAQRDCFAAPFKATRAPLKLQQGSPPHTQCSASAHATSPLCPRTCRHPAPCASANPACAPSPAPAQQLDTRHSCSMLSKFWPIGIPIPDISSMLRTIAAGTKQMTFAPWCVSHTSQHAGLCLLHLSEPPQRLYHRRVASYTICSQSSTLSLDVYLPIWSIHRVLVWQLAGRQEVREVGTCAGRGTFVPQDNFQSLAEVIQCSSLRLCYISSKQAPAPLCSCARSASTDANAGALPFAAAAPVDDAKLCESCRASSAQCCADRRTPCIASLCTPSNQTRL